MLKSKIAQLSIIFLATSSMMTENVYAAEAVLEIVGQKVGKMMRRSMNVVPVMRRAAHIRFLHSSRLKAAPPVTLKAAAPATSLRLMNYWGFNRSWAFSRNDVYGGYPRAYFSTGAGGNNDRWNQGYVPAPHPFSENQSDVQAKKPKTDAENKAEAAANHNRRKPKYDYKNSMFYYTNSEPVEVETPFSVTPKVDNEDMVMFSLEKKNKKPLKLKPEAEAGGAGGSVVNVASYASAAGQLLQVDTLPSQQRVLTTINEVRINRKDGREKVEFPHLYPWIIHGYLEVAFERETYIGSGTLINQHHVLTAAHCLFYQGTLQTRPVPLKVTFYPGRNGGVPLLQSEADQIYIHQKYVNSKDEGYDIGMISLKQKDIGKKTGWARLRAHDDDASLKDLIVSVTGYPSDKLERGHPYMYTMRGSVTAVRPQKFYYQIDTHRGQSGSGVWSTDGTYIDCCGVHVTGSTIEGNGAVRITSDKKDKIGKWMLKQSQEDGQDLLDKPAGVN